MKLFAYLSVFYALNAYGEVPLVPQWSVASLDGVVSYHDGANCFNSVLAAKGYKDFLVHSDGIELRFFLETFCSRNTGKEQAEDILTVLREGTLEHAALSMDRNQIFDKKSTAGLYGRFDDRADSRYRIKGRLESTYITECQSPHCEIQVYSCPSATDVRAQMSRCYGLAGQMGIRPLQAILQSITLANQPAFSLDSPALNFFNTISESLGKMRGTEECGVYILVSASSIFGQIWSLDEERDLGSEWDAARERLRINLFLLKERILKFDRSPKTIRIFQESSWIPDHL